MADPRAHGSEAAPELAIDPASVVAELARGTARGTEARQALVIALRVRALEDVTSSEAQLTAAARCPTSSGWRTLAASTPLGPLAAGAERDVVLEIAARRDLAEIPPMSRVRLGVSPRRFAPARHLAELHWDGARLVDGPPPSLARAEPEGPTLDVELHGVALAADGVPLIGATPAASRLYLSVRYALASTGRRPLARKWLRLFGDCVFPDATRRADEIAKLLRLGELAAPFATSSPLFMGTHVSALPVRCELRFELHGGPFHEPYPELVARRVWPPE